MSRQPRYQFCPELANRLLTKSPRSIPGADIWKLKETLNNCIEFGLCSQYTRNNRRHGDLVNECIDAKRFYDEIRHEIKYDNVHKEIISADDRIKCPQERIFLQTYFSQALLLAAGFEEIPKLSTFINDDACANFRTKNPAAHIRDVLDYAFTFYRRYHNATCARFIYPDEFIRALFIYCVSWVPVSNDETILVEIPNYMISDETIRDVIESFIIYIVQHSDELTNELGFTLNKPDFFHDVQCWIGIAPVNPLELSWAISYMNALDLLSNCQTPMWSISQ